MTDRAAAGEDARAALLDVYDRALPHVYGYLVSRCGERSVAEDLTAETFLAAVDAVVNKEAAAVSVPWIVGVARHKLVDHWRRQDRDRRNLRVAGQDPVAGEDPWETRLDAVRAQAALAQLGGHHRAALTLRYLDDLPVAEVAQVLDRTVHATEALLVRARSALSTPIRRSRPGSAPVWSVAWASREELPCPISPSTSSPRFRRRPPPKPVSCPTWPWPVLGRPSTGTSGPSAPAGAANPS